MIKGGAFGHMLTLWEDALAIDADTGRTAGQVPRVLAAVVQIAGQKSVSSPSACHGGVDCGCLFSGTANGRTGHQRCGR